ncbi:tetratricopeptide repeat-containing sensor histidine kinase [Maribacter sp. X9]|uniref:tetratricopeptide repeat-containing sensor histidine kinase n=1 Tax=Maribacter sp. X9 TaxID=3402159 RepID=UPI003AF380A8
MKDRIILFFKVMKIYLPVLSILFSCSNNKSSLQLSNQTFVQDSIVDLIKESQKLELSEDQRLNLLLRAETNSNKIESDSLKAKYFTLLSSNFPIKKDSILFRKINQKAIALNTSIKDSAAIAMNYKDLGFFFDNYIIQDSAYYSYSEAQEIFESIGDMHNSGEMFLKMAKIQVKIKEYIGSEYSAIQAIERFKPLNNNFELFDSYNVLGIAMGNFGDIPKALSYYNEALYYLKKEPYEEIQEARIINNIGIVHRNNKEFEKAISNFEKVINFKDLEQNRPDLFAIALSNLASSKLYKKDTLGVNDFFKRAIKIKTSENKIASLAGTLYNYSAYKAYARDTLKALELANKAEELSLKTDNNEIVLETWALLASLDKENSHKYFDKYIKLDDSLQKEERKQQNKFARIRFETDEFIAQNVELEGEKELLAKQKQMWTGIAAGFFLLGLSIYIIINQRAKNQKLRFDQQQQINNQEIFNLMLMQKQKVDEVKRMEQKRISEELHDGILGKMLGARMVLTGLNKRATDEAIQEKSKAISSLQEIENEIRSISHELSHTAYQKINNFTDSIETLLESSAKGTNITTIFNYNEDEDWDGLQGDIKINVYRIVQETFQNAVKHANCTIFNITFDINETHFSIIMSDNGVGISPNKGKKGIGMRNISSRINKLEGTWHTDSIEGHGTTTTLKVPLKKKSTNFTDINKQFESV